MPIVIHVGDFLLGGHSISLIDDSMKKMPEYQMAMKLICDFDVKALL